MSSPLKPSISFQQGSMKNITENKRKYYLGQDTTLMDSVKFLWNFNSNRSDNNFLRNAYPLWSMLDTPHVYSIESLNEEKVKRKI